MLFIFFFNYKNKIKNFLPADRRHTTLSARADRCRLAHFPHGTLHTGDCTRKDRNFHGRTFAYRTVRNPFRWAQKEGASTRCFLNANTDCAIKRNGKGTKGHGCNTKERSLHKFCIVVIIWIITWFVFHNKQIILAKLNK